jgi:hypothetical protein
MDPLGIGAERVTYPISLRGRVGSASLSQGSIAEGRGMSNLTAYWSKGVLRDCLGLFSNPAEKLGSVVQKLNCSGPLTQFCFQEIHSQNPSMTKMNKDTHIW